jgi:hypothetical protein
LADAAPPTALPFRVLVGVAEQATAESCPIINIASMKLCANLRAGAGDERH